MKKLISIIKDKKRLYRILFEGTDRLSKPVDIAIMIAIALCIIMASLESGTPQTRFTSIPTSIYWAIVTLTTVGYGDITPVTALGKFLSGIVMILGYTIIAVPTGIVSATMIDTTQKKGKNGRCPRCNQKTDLSANYCKHCGERL